MPISSESLSRLADKIGVNYAEKVHDAYFQETTEKTYKKWFNKNGHKHSKLDPYKHSGDITIGPDGKAHYWALKKKYYHVRKKGKHFVPNKFEMSQAVRQAYKTMNAFSVRIRKTKTGSGVEMKMAYDPNVRMAEYKGGYKAVLWQGIETMKYKTGKINQFDRILLDSLREWGNDEGYKIVVKSSYEGS